MKTHFQEKLMPAVVAGKLLSQQLSIVRGCQAPIQIVQLTDLSGIQSSTKDGAKYQPSKTGASGYICKLSVCVCVPHLHYLLTQITSESARLAVRGNTELNGFESWRLLAKRFSLPGTAVDNNLLTSVLEFRFRLDQFEQSYSEWETLKARYERQLRSALPDSILVATMPNLNKTTEHCNST